MGKGSAIVVAHNSGVHIEECLHALCRQTGWEIVLVDNGSSDDTLARVSNFTQVRILANDHNLGFAGAINQALNLTGSNTTVVLNPDAVPAPGALDRLAAALVDPLVGAAGGLLVGNDGLPQRGFVIRRFPGLAVMVCECLLLNRLWPRNPWNRRYRCLDADYTRAQVVEQPAGAALAFRRQVWQAIGGFDEQFYPVWFEDVDFCRRTREAGWKVFYEPTAVFRHAGAHSVHRLSFTDQQLFWYRNLLRYFRKHHGIIQSLVLRAAIAIGTAIRSAAVVAGVGPASVDRREALRAFRLVVRQCVCGLTAYPSAAPKPGSGG